MLYYASRVASHVYTFLYTLYMFVGWCRLMHVRNANCMYVEAESSWHDALQYVARLDQHGVTINRATLCSEYSTLLFARSQYDEVTYGAY